MILLESGPVRILAPLSELNYFDVQSADIPDPMSALEAWNRIMAQPQPFLKVAFKIRDQVSSLFGVKKIGGFAGRAVETVKVGDHIDFFLVEHCDDETLVLTERDSHLDVMTCVSTAGGRVAVTSSVKVHNLFGHLYMVPVGIAHRWIVRAMLRRLQRDMAQARP